MLLNQLNSFSCAGGGEDQGQQMLADMADSEALESSKRALEDFGGLEGARTGRATEEGKVEHGLSGHTGVRSTQ